MLLLLLSIFFFWVFIVLKPLEGGPGRKLAEEKPLVNKATVLYIGRIPHGFYEKEMQGKLIWLNFELFLKLCVDFIYLVIGYVGLLISGWWLLCLQLSLANLVQSRG